MWKKTKEMKWKTAKLLWGDLFYDIAGAVLFAAGVYTFAGNADFAPGGITGISLLLNHVFGIPVGTLTLFINLPLIVISYRTLGKRFLLKTAKSMVITTFFLDVVFPVFPMYEGQRMMAALCSGALMGAGMVMFYMRGSSSGGLDFVIMPIKKKRPHLSVGKITMIIDLGIILLGWPVFGDVDATGTYTGKKKNVLLCACSKSEAFLVKCAAEEADENMFLMFMETSEVFGEGFRSSSD